MHGLESIVTLGFFICPDLKEIFMAKHSTEKGMGSKSGKLKIYGGFKAMEGKMGGEKKSERKK